MKAIICHGVSSSSTLIYFFWLLFTVKNWYGYLVWLVVLLSVRLKLYKYIKRCRTILNWKAVAQGFSHHKLEKCTNIIFVPSCVHLWNFQFHFLLIAQHLLHTYAWIIIFIIFWSNMNLVQNDDGDNDDFSSTISYVWFIFLRWNKNGVNCIWTDIFLYLLQVFISFWCAWVYSICIVFIEIFSFCTHLSSSILVVWCCMLFTKWSFLYLFIDVVCFFFYFFNTFELLLEIEAKFPEEGIEKRWLNPTMLWYQICILYADK